MNDEILNAFKRKSKGLWAFILWKFEDRITGDFVFSSQEPFAAEDYLVFWYEKMLNLKAKPEEMTKLIRQNIFKLVQLRYFNLARLLIDHNVLDASQMILCFHAASQLNSTSLVDVLLKLGLDINCKVSYNANDGSLYEANTSMKSHGYSSQWSQPLTITCLEYLYKFHTTQGSNFEMTKLLLRNGASVTGLSTATIDSIEEKLGKNILQLDSINFSKVKK